MTRAHLLLLLLCVIWGLTFPLVQIGLADASPFAFVAVRFLIAALLFPLLVWPRAHRLNGDLVKKGLVLGVLLCAGFVLQTFGLGLTTAARAGFITGLFVPFTPLFAWLLFRERIVLRLWFAVGLAVIGLSIMSWPRGGVLNWGDVFVFFCAVTFALQVVLVDRWVSHENEYQLTWMQFLVTLAVTALCLPTQPLRFELTSSLLWILLYCSTIGTAIAIWWQLRYQPLMSSTAAAVIFATEPIFAALWSWLIQGQVPPFSTLVGAAFILSAMLLSVPVKKVLSTAVLPITELKKATRSRL